MLVAVLLDDEHAVVLCQEVLDRLIEREATDPEVIDLEAPRLQQRAYGRIFLASLPGMPVTREVGDVSAFFAVDEPVLAGPAGAEG